MSNSGEPDGTVARDSVIRTLIEDLRKQRQLSHGASAFLAPAQGTSEGRSLAIGIGEEIRAGDAFDAKINKAIEYPGVLLQAAVIQLGEKVPDGRLVEGVSIAWWEIVRELDRDPEFLYKVPWRKLEQIIAGAYEREGWDEVILTPPSVDTRNRPLIDTSKPAIS